jgi:myo-inositol 2-dehydrogenase/D-chiro-inositol 1-dehydrogenase
MRANERWITMRLGLLGLGRIGDFHADTLASLPLVDSIVVADIIPSLTKKVAERLRAEPAASPDALLKSGLDGVVIAASTDAHPELIVAAVDAGLPVFCEKPLARTIAEGVEVLQRVQASDVPVQIGYQRRFDVAYQAAHDAVAAGELGWLHTVRSTTLDPAPPTPEYVAVSGGIFRDCGVHDFDIIRWVTGREVVEVYATGSNRGAGFFAAAGDVDTSAAVLTLDDGTLALVSNTRYNPRGYDVRLEVHGSKDSIAVGLEKKLPLRSVEPLATFPLGEPHRLFMDRFLPAYRSELDVFTELVAGDRSSPCTVADALEADLIAEACGLSLREHRPVRIDEVKP